MAYDDTLTDTADTATATEPAMSEEERRRKQAEAEFEMRKAEEEARLNALDVAGTPRNQGRIYIGPPISEGQFNQLPTGARITPPPPVLSPDEQMAAQRRIAPESDAAVLARLQAADLPGRTTLGVQSERDPETLAAAAGAQRKFEAERTYRWMVANGATPADALAQSGVGLFGTTAAKPMTAYESAQIAERQAALKQREDEAARRYAVKPPLLKDDPAYKANLAEDARIQTALNKLAMSQMPEQQKLDQVREWTRQRRLLMNKRQEIEAQYSTGGAAAVPPTVTGTGTVLTSSVQPPAPRTLPKTKGELVRGQSYSTNRGVLFWDGSKFVRSL